MLYRAMCQYNLAVCIEARCVDNSNNFKLAMIQSPKNKCLKMAELSELSREALNTASRTRHDAIAALLEAQQVLNVTPAPALAPAPAPLLSPTPRPTSRNLDATKQRKFRSLSVSTAVSEHPDDAWMHHALAAVASREVHASGW
jgi:hypothetical protein